jgi:hypothetical protein
MPTADANNQSNIFSNSLAISNQLQLWLRLYKSFEIYQELIFKKYTQVKKNRKADFTIRIKFANDH